MIDIVQRLRKDGVITVAEWDKLRADAADEIERCREIAFDAEQEAKALKLELKPNK